MANPIHQKAFHKPQTLASIVPLIVLFSGVQQRLTQRRTAQCVYIRTEIYNYFFIKQCVS